MACPTVTTGNAFLASVLNHIDCQAEILGSYGFQSLAQPGGAGAVLLASALVTFVALLGLRLILGGQLNSADFVSLTLRAGIVLSLAASWPALRTLGYDTVLDGPSQIVSSIADPSAMPAVGEALRRRLEDMDQAILALTVRGTGRTTGATGYASAQSMREAALDDGSAMGWSRVVWLAGTLAPMVALRLCAGFLLAVTPLLSLSLLFEATRGWFAGWAKALFLCFLGSVAITVLQAAQLAILEPWATDALRMRNVNYATPAVPTELLAINLAFAIAANLMLAVLTKVAFQSGWMSAPNERARVVNSEPQDRRLEFQVDASLPGVSRAEQLALSIDRLDRMNDAGPSERIPQAIVGDRTSTETKNDGFELARPPRLGESYRRSARSASLAGKRRDGQG